MLEMNISPCWLFQFVAIDSQNCCVFFEGVYIGTISLRKKLPSVDITHILTVWTPVLGEAMLYTSRMRL